jgi:hypothetical protein
MEIIGVVKDIKYMNLRNEIPTGLSCRILPSGILWA